jgi:hypothetical protein
LRQVLVSTATRSGFKKYAVLAGINEPKKSCHGVRKARAEVAAYADCTESQMMAMFGWTEPKMPAHYIAQANREKHGISVMEKIVAFDERQSLDDFMRLPRHMRTPPGNGGDIPGQYPKKDKDFNTKFGGGALGGTRTPTMLLTATSRQRVYQFRHEREGRTGRDWHRPASTAPI